MANNKSKKKHRGAFHRPEVDVTIRTSLYALFAVAAGAVAVSFILATDFIYNNIYPKLLQQGHWVVVWGSLLAIIVSSLIVGFLQSNFLPGKSPNGIPNLKVFYTRMDHKLSFRQVLINFICGVVSLGGGTSLGREGPTVFAGGAVAVACADALGMTKPRRRLACVAGAAAGLAAAFNTPVAAVMFVIEAISEKFNRQQLGGVLIASVLGAVASWLVIGRHPAFNIPELSAISKVDYLLAPIVALFAAMAGNGFQRLVLRIRRTAKSNGFFSPFWKPLVGGLCVWVLAITAYFVSFAYGDPRLGVFSMGFDDLSEALAGNVIWQIAFVLLACKVFATAIACAWGCSGGIFAPSLFFGAMVGLVVAGVAQTFGANMAEHGTLLLALVGMSACFGAVFRTPITALMIVFEMSSRYEIVPILMIAAVISQAYTHYFGDKVNIYDALLRQDGIDLSNKE